MGIDLAWGERSPSAVAVINTDGVLTRASPYLSTVNDIFEFADLAGGEGAVVAVDAPLIVRNVDRCRPVERCLTELFWPYDAGPYPANLSNTAFQSTAPVARLIRDLHARGFAQRLTPLQDPNERTFIEVFPSPAQVILFPAQNRRQHIHSRGLRYKAKRGRAWNEVHSEWEIYRARLRSLERCNPPMKLTSEVQKQIDINITEYSGSRYKRFDDLLDGIFCAYLAYYFWHTGEHGCWVFGDLESGCVTLPRCSLPACPLAQEILRSAKPR